MSDKSASKLLIFILFGAILLVVGFVFVLLSFYANQLNSPNNNDNYSSNNISEARNEESDENQDDAEQNVSSSIVKDLNFFENDTISSPFIISGSVSSEWLAGEEFNILIEDSQRQVLDVSNIILEEEVESYLSFEAELDYRVYENLSGKVVFVKGEVTENVPLIRRYEISVKFEEVFIYVENLDEGDNISNGFVLRGDIKQNIINTGLSKVIVLDRNQDVIFTDTLEIDNSKVENGFMDYQVTINIPPNTTNVGTMRIFHEPSSDLIDPLFDISFQVRF